MTESKRGLYEVLVTQAIESSLGQLDQSLVAQSAALRPADAADRVALHVSRLVQRVLAGVPDAERVSVGVGLARKLVEEIERVIDGTELDPDMPVEAGTVLRAIAGRLPDGTPEIISAPLIPLLDTTLLSNAPGEPNVGHQLRTEIHSADRIDVVMAFIRSSGIRRLLAAIRDHCAAGRSVRVITTSYTGSTEMLALEALREAGAEIRVSYDTTTTRLHAKAWLFHRKSGFSTAYIGSSNLTHSAQVAGLEWNVRVSGARNPDVVQKVEAVFETYWNSEEFAPYVREEFVARTGVDEQGRRKLPLSPFELRPEPFQERLLEQIALAREQGHHRNLLVSATGTGKTVIAAVDYARLREQLPRARLLFVAHREEILEQSLAKFRHCLRDQSFGQLWVGGLRPNRFDHVFASIQSLRATGVAHLPRDHFDVVIVDEFHHAAAVSYRALLDHVTPRELLGLTATPERGDGVSILDWFDGRIAGELRLWDAIDQHRLVPFIYYGIHDGLDLRDIPWRRGRGYDSTELSNLYTANDVWAKQVISQLNARVDDLSSMRALGFCVSVQHAEFMARVFRENGIPAVAISAQSSDQQRDGALRDLVAKTVNVVFSVDLFNEGVDIPSVDTLLLLRPTDSSTLFLQQLGRGLRRSAAKSVCTVLDFVGLHRSEFRFDQRFGALLGVSRKQLEEQVREGFPYLPAGCHMELDRVASEIVLKSIRDAVPSRWSAKVEALRELSGGDPVDLTRYLHETGLDIDDVYSSAKAWSDLCADAGLPLEPDGPHEEPLRRACSRLLHINDMVRIDAYQRFLAATKPPNIDELSVHDRRLLRMLIASVVERAATKTMTLGEACELLWAHPQVISEVKQQLTVLSTRVDHLHRSVANRPNLPLQVHARYSRIEILAAFGVGEAAKVAPWQSGVYWARDARADLLAVTLDKTGGDFSPTTRYRDYAISRELIHWESQSVTRADSETGQRYQTHVERGSDVMLFARLSNDDRAFWFLGPAMYVKHESELPMAVTWRLHSALPGDLFARFAAAVA